MNRLHVCQVRDGHGDKTTENPVFGLIEAVCISWFTVEYLLRLAGAPSKLHFVKRPLNVVDVLAILPYYLSLSLLEDRSSLLPQEGAEESKLDEVGRIVLVFRIARILRIFKLARSSEGLQVGQFYTTDCFACRVDV